MTFIHIYSKSNIISLRSFNVKSFIFINMEGVLLFVENIMIEYIYKSFRNNLHLRVRNHWH